MPIDRSSLCVWWQRLFCWEVVLAIAIPLTGACSRDPEARKARYLQSGDRYATQGRIAESVIEYRNAIQAAPQDGEARLKLADALWNTGDANGAAGEYVRAADLLLDRVDVQLKAGNLLLLGGRSDDAKVRAEKALAVAPRDVEAQILLANALAGLKNFEAAIAEIEEAIRLDPERGRPYTRLGAFEAERGRPEAAERAFQRAVELDGNSVAAHLALANFYWDRQRWADAERATKRALDVDPENILAHRAMASLAFAFRPAEAEHYLKKIVDLTNSPRAALSLADFHISQNNQLAARELLQPLTSSPVLAAEASVRLAALDHAAGRREDAHTRLDRVLASDGANLQALVTRSALLLAAGQPDDALAAARKAVEANPDSAIAYFALARAHEARHDAGAAATAYRDVLRVNPRATGAHVALARLNLTAGRAGEAVGFARDALKTNPADPDARLALVRGLIARGELVRAEPELKRLSAEFPNSAAVRVQNGLLLGHRKDLSGARREFERALELAPDSLDALGGLMALDLAMKQPGAALARLKDRLDRDDEAPALLMLASRTYLATGDVQTSERLLRRLLLKDPTYLQAYTALGQLYLRQHRLDAALAEFESMVQRDPKPVVALTVMGIILEAQGKPAEARQRYERALQADPAAAVAANNLAFMYALSGGNLDVALQLAQTAYSKLPDTPEVGHTLGFVYYKKDLLPQAIQVLRATVEKEPTRPLYHHHLGLAFAKHGDTALARQALEKALALKPDFSGAQEARAVLQSLTGSD